MRISNFLGKMFILICCENIIPIRMTIPIRLPCECVESTICACIDSHVRRSCDKIYRKFFFAFKDIKIQFKTDDKLNIMKIDFANLKLKKKYFNSCPKMFWTCSFTYLMFTYLMLIFSIFFYKTFISTRDLVSNFEMHLLAFFFLLTQFIENR